MALLVQVIETDIALVKWLSLTSGTSLPATFFTSHSYYPIFIFSSLTNFIKIPTLIVVVHPLTFPLLSFLIT